jgi:lipoprotein-anchoring transpeptidase ErfK/SrfK
VNITTQTLVAYEGDKPVFTTIVSSGRHDDEDKTKDHRTPTGSFRIREKHIATTMDDDSAVDGPYSIEDVPWVMYFEKGIALHGAFWHSSFGKEHSHGCVNMLPHDARQIFQWVGPKLPEGWHAVRSTAENPGTRVIVHE